MLSRAYVQRPGCNHSNRSKTTSLRGKGATTSNKPEKGATTTAIANETNQWGPQQPAISKGRGGPQATSQRKGQSRRQGQTNQGKGTGNKSKLTIETIQSAACSKQHGKQSSQQTAACFHFFIEENIGKVKSAGCLLWGSPVCSLCKGNQCSQ